MTAKVQIFGLPFSTFVRSIMLCCEEKGIEYSVGLVYEGQPIELKSEQHLKLHPFAKFPVLIHGENKLFETASICRYLDAQFDGLTLQAKDIINRSLVDQWSAAISIYIDKVLVRDYLLEFAFPKGENNTVRMEVLAEVEPKAIQILQELELLLADKPFICGKQYSMADALLTPMLDYLFYLPTKAKLFQSTPKLLTYIQRMQARPSGVKVLKLAKAE